MFTFCIFKHGIPTREYAVMFALSFLAWRNVLKTGMHMIPDVSVDEIGEPFSCMIDICKELGITAGIFQRLEKRLDEWIIIADSGAEEVVKMH